MKAVDIKVARYIAVSGFIKDDLIQCGIKADKIEVIYNGTQIVQPIVAHIDGSANNLTIGIVGQIIQRKGHEDVIEALRILQQQGMHISLVIIGRGDKIFVEHLENLIVNIS